MRSQPKIWRKIQKIGGDIISRNSVFLDVWADVDEVDVDEVDEADVDEVVDYDAFVEQSTALWLKLDLRLQGMVSADQWPHLLRRSANNDDENDFDDDFDADGAG